MSSASRWLWVLLLGCLPLRAVYAQADPPRTALDALQQQRQQLREQRSEEALNESVGPSRAELKQAFIEALASPVRRHIEAFDAQLGAADKLDTLQIKLMAQLVAEVHLQQVRRTVALQPNEWLDPRPPTNPLLHEVWRQYATIAAYEDALRERELQADLMLARVPAMLKRQQLRAYVRWQAAELNVLRGEIERLRGLARLPPEIPELPAPGPRAVDL